MNTRASGNGSDPGVRQQTLPEWNRTERAYPDGCVHQLFQRQVERTPEAIALIHGEKHLTYRELNRQSNHLAHCLQKRGIGPKVMVGLCVDPSLDAIVGVMGILKAGGAYVPLDPGYPRDRLAEMILDASLSLVTTHAGLEDRLPVGVETLCLDRESSHIAAESSENSDSGCTLDSPAYVLYTSGSTGPPKGIVGIHRSIVNGLLSVSYAPGERCCLNASLSFGLSLANLFLPLMCGVPLVILSEAQLKDIREFVNVLEKEEISRLVLVPPVFKQILDLGPNTISKLRSIRAVGLVGAALTPDLVKRFAEAIPQAKLHNCYSSSEIGTLATVWNVTAESVANGEVVIGRPVANTQIYILDEQMNPVPPGVHGELFVGARHLARGYLNRPALTAERFVPDPFAAEPDRRLFRTGDVGVFRPDGEVEFLGRVDEQVKIRGFRIELGEVERALASHNSVGATAASVREVGGEPRIVGYVVPRSLPSPTVTELRNYLKERLPDYMIPSVLMFLESLPLSRNGKVDRSALPPPDAARPALAGEYREPRNPVEMSLVEIWRGLLGVERVGIDDSFFELGGDSLFATQLAAQIQDRLGAEISLETLFDRPTVAELAAYLESLHGIAEPYDSLRR